MSFRRHAVAGAFVAATALAVLLLAFVFDTAKAQPSVPYPLVKITTKSGNVTRETMVPIGHIPVPIDVDDGGILGLLNPDIDVAVGFLSLQDLPGKPIVPSLTVTRNVLAQTLGRKAPQLSVDAEIAIVDLGSILDQPILPILPLDRTATIHIGYSTPDGAVQPPRVSMRLTSQLTSITDPLEARVEVPDYDAPLDLHVNADTASSNVKFDLGFDPIPEQIRIVEDPIKVGDATTGLDFHSEFDGSSDVDLTGHAELKDKVGDKKVKVIDARMERLPKTLDLHQNLLADTTEVEYRYTSPLAAPDLEATYQARDSANVLETFARVRAGALPPHLRGTLTYKGEGKDKQIDNVDVNALDGGAIGVLDVLARNYEGADPLPKLKAGPRQLIQAATRVVDGKPRWRASARVEKVRHVGYQVLDDAKGKGVALTTKLGDGKLPLKVALDVDDRGDANKQDAKHIVVESTVRPLPSTLDATYQAANEGTPGEPVDLSYNAASTTDVDADVLISKGASDACGASTVTCLKAAIDGLPAPTLTATLPTKDGADYHVNHTGPTEPDIRATVDATPANLADRKYVEIGVQDVPSALTARIERDEAEQLRGAEFHACDWSFSGGGSCINNTTLDALKSVDFTVRARPDRGTLPPQPATGTQHISVLKRGAESEVVGHVDDIKGVLFRQVPGVDDAPPRIVAFDVTAGGQQPFDVRIDQDADGESSDIRAHIDALPENFGGCVRPGTEQPSLPAGGSAAFVPCEVDLPVKIPVEEKLATPLAIGYHASSGAKVSALVDKTDAKGVRTKISSSIDEVPTELQAAYVTAAKPTEDDPGHRNLRVGYRASKRIGNVSFAMDQSAGGRPCGSPQAVAKHLCLSARLSNVPRTINAEVHQRDDGKEIRVAAPREFFFEPRMNIDRVTLDDATPGADGSRIRVEGKVNGIPKLLKATILDNPDPAEKIGRIRFDACPSASWADGDPDADDCFGTGLIDATVRTSLASDALVGDSGDPDDIISEPPGDGVELTQRDEGMRAHVRISHLRALELNKLTDDGDAAATLRMLAAIGSGDGDDSLDIDLDRYDKQSRQLVDATIDHLPSSLLLCYRGDASSENAGRCGEAQTGKTAIVVQSSPVDNGERPDIDVHKLIIKTEAGKFIAGRAKIEDLAQRIDVLADTADESTAVDISGHDIGDATGSDSYKAVAGRISFQLATFLDAPTGDAFPWVPLEPGAPDVVEQNNIKILKTPERLYASGSVPDIRHVAFGPRPCPAAQAQAGRFPERDGLKYTCVQVLAAPGQALGLTARTIDADKSVVSLEDGLVSKLPDGRSGLQVTIGKSADSLKEAPVCADGVDGDCRAPLLSVNASRLDTGPGTAPRLEGRLALGPRDAVLDLAKAKPEDVLSARIPFEEHPADWGGGARGVRVKVGTHSLGTAVRAGLRLDLPQYFDVDPVTLVKCTVGCDEEGWTDIALRVAGSEVSPLGSDVATLGRVALFVHAFDKKSATPDVVLTGTTPSYTNPDELPIDDPAHDPVQDWERGFAAPGHIDEHLYIRGDEFATGDFVHPSKNPPYKRQFIQLDSRTNQPLSLAARLLTQSSGVTNRSGTRVPDVGLALRNTPAADFDTADPGFRLRAIIDKPYDKTKPPLARNGTCSDVHKTDDLVDGHPHPDGTDLVGHPKLLTSCLYGPYTKQGWVDLSLDAQPAKDEDAVRRIDAGVDTLGGANNVRVSSFANLGDKQPGGQFSAKGGIRLQEFELGAELGLTHLGRAALVATATTPSVILGIGSALALAGVGGDNAWRFRGDLEATFDVDKAFVASIGQSKAAAAAAGIGGDVTVDATMRSRFTTEDYGLSRSTKRDPKEVTEDPASPDDPTPLREVGFHHCTGGVNDDALVAAANQGVVDTFFDFVGIPAKMNAVYELARKLVLCPKAGGTLRDVGPIGPSFVIEGREVPGSEQVVFEKPAVDTGVDSNPEVDVKVPEGETWTLCGYLAVRSLKVMPGATVKVGTEGESPTSIPGVFQPDECHGQLIIGAEDVSVFRDGDQIGRIDASDAAPTPGPGDGPALGSGGGNAGFGGKSGGGAAGGPAVGLEGDHGLYAAYGSQGGGAFLPRGGGVIVIIAPNLIRVEGEIRADGGSSTDFVDGDCSDQLDGGGSGGAVVLSTADLLTGPGAVISANGGDGTSGDHELGGGAGGGGYIDVDSVLRNDDSVFQAKAGAAGVSSDCADGGAADFGKITLTADERSATAERYFDVGQPWIGEGQDINGSAPVAVRFRAIQRDGGPVQLIYCYRRADLTVENGLGSGLIDPSAMQNVTPENLVNAPQCQKVNLNPDEGTQGTYTFTPQAYQLEDGFYGFYALAAKPDEDGVNCISEPSKCDFQETLPTFSPVKVAVDTDPPEVSATAQNGIACAGGEHCVSDEIVIGTGGSDDKSGLDHIECWVEGVNNVHKDCGPTTTFSMETGGDGPQKVIVRAFDRAGNTADKELDFFVDGTAPSTPDVTINDLSVKGTDGWLKGAPAVTVTSTDAAFADKPIELLVDGVPTRCGDDGVFSTCLPAQTAAIVPTDGIHQLQARATDALGNTSELSEPQEIRIDSKPPHTALSLAPAVPDGGAGWFRTQPQIGLGGVDAPGGSGIWLMRYRIDGGDWIGWTPQLDHHMPEGIHEICWSAVDNAGNVEPVGDGSCRTVKVDTGKPSATIKVPAPDGLEQWNVGAVNAVTQANDLGSDVASAELSLDGAAWTNAPQIAVPAGIHSVRLHVVDKAGNERTAEVLVKRDDANPAAEAVPWVPQDNAQGWRRGFAAVTDGLLDSREGSGISGAFLKLDDNVPAPYEGEITVGEGVHAVSGRATDRSGRIGVQDPAATLRIDTTAPSAKATLPAPIPALLPGQTTQLRYDAGGTGTPRVKVRILIYSVLLGQKVKTITVPGQYAGGYRDAGPGQVTWDGSIDAGGGALLGAYVYRVQVIDQAYNTAISTESAPITLVGLPKLPNVIGGVGGLLGGLTGKLGL